jgi:hypothetical protein
MMNGPPEFADFLGLVEAKFQTDERGRLVGSAPHCYLPRTFDNISSQRVAQRLSLSLVASEFSLYCQPNLSGSPSNK